MHTYAHHAGVVTDLRRDIRRNEGRGLCYRDGPCVKKVRKGSILISSELNCKLTSLLFLIINDFLFSLFTPMMVDD